MIMFSIVMSLSCWMIAKAWNKWDENPVIVSLNEKSTPIWKVPFPAVTICPEVKAVFGEIKLNFRQIYRKRELLANMSEPM